MDQDEANQKLFAAIAEVEIDDVRAALDAGANPDAKDGNGFTALVRAQALDIAELLLARGANPNLACDNGRTPLVAALKTDAAHVAMLLDAGVDPMVRDAEGNTLLHLLARSADLEIAELLIAKGVPIDARNNAGKAACELSKKAPWQERLRVAGFQTPAERLADLDAGVLVPVVADAELYADRGWTRQVATDFDGAIGDYRRALDIDRDHDRALGSLGDCLIEVGRSEQAIAVLDQRIARAPEDGYLRLARAEQNDKLGRADAVLADAAVLRANRQSIDKSSHQTLAALVKRAWAARGEAEPVVVDDRTPVQIAAAYYKVSLPAEYVAFLDARGYASYPNHRPGHLPSYRTTPRLYFLVGHGAFGMEDGEAFLSDLGDAETIRDELFSGIESQYEEDELPCFIPLALLEGGGQSIALDTRGGGCAVVMYDHEPCKFYPVADTLAEFLAELVPMTKARDTTPAADRPGVVKDELLWRFRSQFGEDHSDEQILATDPNNFDADPSTFYESLSEAFGVAMDSELHAFGGFGGTIEHTIAFIAARWDGTLRD